MQNLVVAFSTDALIQAFLFFQQLSCFLDSLHFFYTQDTLEESQVSEWWRIQIAFSPPRGVVYISIRRVVMVTKLRNIKLLLIWFSTINSISHCLSPSFKFTLLSLSPKRSSPSQKWNYYNIMFMWHDISNCSLIMVKELN